MGLATIGPKIVISEKPFKIEENMRLDDLLNQAKGKEIDVINDMIEIVVVRKIKNYQLINVADISLDVEISDLISQKCHCSEITM